MRRFLAKNEASLKTDQSDWDDDGGGDEVEEANESRLLTLY